MTSDDVALLLQKLAGKKLLTHDNTALLLGYMQRATMRDFILAGTPNGATAYHKTGYLSDRLHDVAIISKGDRSFVLAIFSKTSGSYNFGKGASLFKEITSKASESFF
jgi:beta-lactamase class A